MNDQSKDTVVVELTILCVVETMHEKTEARANSINFWLNESSHCLDNEIRMLGEIQGQWDRESGQTRIYHRAEEKTASKQKCFCVQAQARYIREATAEDRLRLGYDAWIASHAPRVQTATKRPGWFMQLLQWWFS